jgi:hypothetical protein
MTSMKRSTVLLSATIGFGLLYLAAFLALGSTPDAGDDGQQVVAWFRGHDGDVRLSVWLLTIAMPFFAVLAALIRAQLPAPYRDVFFFGAIALVAETAVQAWLWGGMAWHADQLEPATARTLLDIASFWGPVLTSTTVTMLAPVALLALRGDPAVPRWLGLTAGVAVVEQVVETITVFGKSGFIAPGGAMNVVLGAGLVAIAILGLGISAARRSATV